VPHIHNLTRERGAGNARLRNLKNKFEGHAWSQSARRRVGADVGTLRPSSTKNGPSVSSGRTMHERVALGWGVAVFDFGAASAASKICEPRKKAVPAPPNSPIISRRVKMRPTEASSLSMMKFPLRLPWL